MMHDRIRWTPELIAHAQRIRNEFSLTYAGIADRMCTSETAIKRLFQRLLDVPRRPSRSWTFDETERAIDAEMDGIPIATIAAQLGRPYEGTKKKLYRERHK